MAFDIVRGTQVGRDWSMSLPTRAALSYAGKKIPWKKILIAGGIGAGTLFLLTRKNPTVITTYRRPRRATTPTMQIPRESMRDLVYGRKG